MLADQAYSSLTGVTNQFEGTMCGREKYDTDCSGTKPWPLQEDVPNPLQMSHPCCYFISYTLF